MSIYSVNQILNDHFYEYRQSHNVAAHQMKAAYQLMDCRTSALGGHSYYCENGHLNGVFYNSCKHRSCPQCCAMPTKQWLQAASNLLINDTHHHWVFTIPHEFNSLWQFNRELFQDILFVSVKETIKKLASDPKYLGAMPGILMALHTWGRNLTLHPHIHCLITDGGVKNDCWIKPKRKIFIPVKVITAVFKAIFTKHLRNEYKAREIKLPTKMNESGFYFMIGQVYKKTWNVECCKPYRNGNGIATYLAKYVRGGAIKNQQIKKVSKQEVVFSYKNYKKNKQSLMTLSIDAFIGRVLEHVSVSKKMTIRRFGIYHNSCRKQLDIIKNGIGQQITQTIKKITSLVFMKSIKREMFCKQCEESLLNGYRKKLRRW